MTKKINWSKKIKAKKQRDLVSLHFGKDEIEWLLNPKSHSDIQKVVAQKYAQFLLGKKRFNKNEGK